jgi:hypothetical protein
VLILELVEKLSAAADGDSVTLPLGSPDERQLAAAWCERTGNTLVAAGEEKVTAPPGSPA